MRTPLWIACVLLAGLVGVSVYHQLRRPPALGSRLATALQQVGFSERITPAPPVSEYRPGARNGFFELAFTGGSLWIERGAARVALRGPFDEAASVRDDGVVSESSPGTLLSLPRQTRRLSRDAVLVKIDAAVAGGEVDGDGYRLSFHRGPGAVGKLLERDDVLDAALTRALTAEFGDAHRARRVVADQRKALLGMTERALFDALLAADAAVLRRDDDPAGAVRRAMLLCARPPVEIAITWNDNAAWAITDRARAPSGESIVRGFGFSLDGSLVWSALLFVRDGVEPERLLSVIDGIGGVSR